MTVVEELRLYMTYRAMDEKAPFDDLTPLQAPYDNGERFFFGVTVDNTGIVADQHAPLVLARYRDLCMLHKLSQMNRLYATIDIDGAPFHRVTATSEKTDKPGTYILWLEPQGRDDDLRTPMTPITIRTDQFGMVVAGLRLLRNTIGTATLDEDLEAIITSGGAMFPTSEEIDAFCEMLGLPDDGASA